MMDRTDTKVGLVFHIISQVDCVKKIASTHACNVTFGMNIETASWKFNSTPFVSNEF